MLHCKYLHAVMKNRAFLLFRYGYSYMTMSSRSVHNCIRGSIKCLDFHKSSCQSLHMKYFVSEAAPTNTKERVTTNYEIQIEETTDKVYEYYRSCNIMIVSSGKERVKDYVQHLIDLKLKINDIEQLMLASPKILINEDMCTLTKQLREYGFSPKQMVHILSKFPDILDMNFETFLKNLEIFRNIGFSDDVLMALVVSDPTILLLEQEDVCYRVDELKKMFLSKSVLQLIVKSPSVLTEDINVIHLKYDYVSQKMGATPGQVIRSNLFSHSLDYIKCRHQFLTRAGLYKKVTKDTGEIGKNPSLREMLDTSDEIFAKKHSKMTVAEYQTFVKIFEKEMTAEEVD
ncbi:transcription termination factor 4, mitochondrial-like [Mytilus trossulus]|uniref:transcription termination factor 4, mitochondrial-like n=1 Tax=Mytilus trossulus TaxID=6551 RepID=UPI0030064C6F